MKNRLQVISLIAAFILVNIMPVTIFAADTAVIEVSTVSGKQGDQISVPVRISGNPTIAGYEMTVLFDNSKLQYTGFTENNSLFPKPSGTNIDAANANGKISFISANLQGLSKIDKEIPDGILITLNFTVLTISDDVTLDITNVHLMNASNENLSVRASGGRVTAERTAGNTADSGNDESAANNTNTDDDNTDNDTKSNPGSSLIEVGAASGKQGDQISVPVRISGNPTIAGYEMTVLFDSSKLQYTGFTANDSLFPKPSGTNIDTANTNGKISFISANLQGLSKIDKEIPDGILVTLNFTILTISDDAALNITDAHMMNADNENLSVRASGGRVTAEKTAGNTADTGNDESSGNSANTDTDNADNDIKDNPESSLPKNPAPAPPTKEDYEKGKIDIEVTPQQNDDGTSTSTVSIPVDMTDSAYENTKNANGTFTFGIKNDYGAYNLPANIVSIIPNFENYKDVSNIKITITDTAKNEKIAGALSGIVRFTLELLDKNGRTISEITDFSGAIERIIPLPPNTKKPEYWGVWVRKDSKSAWEFTPAKWTAGGILISSGMNGEYVAVEYKPSFTDVLKNAWYYENVTTAASKLLVKGMNTEGTVYNPENQVTRAEFTTMIVRALSLPAAKSGTANYSDVKADDWFYEVIIKAKSAGILTNLAVNNEFKPNQPMLREEMAYVLEKAAEYAKITSDKKIVFSERFTDSATVSAKYINSVEKIVSLGLMEGMSSTTFDGQGKITRAQAATILVRLTKLLNFID
jgi:hypothetical protein